MKIALIQSNLQWENPTGNRTHFEEQMASVSNVDLIVLPEMFATGFTMKPHHVAEKMTGDSINWMKDLAVKKDTAICGSLAIAENGLFYNRFVFVFPNGDLEYYDKRHLFTFAGEDKAYTSGKEKQIITYKDWKICLQVCYDLRFPVFARNVENYDLLLYVANWPVPRIDAWDSLLKARAIENMCYVASVNRMGDDANGHHYPGHSQIVDYLGKYVIAPTEEQGVFMTTLNKQELLEAREKFAFLNDRDDFTVR